MPAMEDDKRSSCPGGGAIEITGGLVAGWLVAGAVLLLALIAPASASANTPQQNATHVSLYKELLVLVGDAQSITHAVDDEKKRVEGAIKSYLGVVSFTDAQQKKFDAVVGPVYREAIQNSLQDIASAEASYFTADEIRGLIAAHSLPAAVRFREVINEPRPDEENTIEQYLRETVASIVDRYRRDADARPNLKYDWPEPVHKLLMATGHRAYVEDWAASYIPLLKTSVDKSIGAIADQEDGMRLDDIMYDESMRLLDWFIIREMNAFSDGLSPRDIAALNTALAGVAQDKLNRMQNGGSNVSRYEIFEGHLRKAALLIEAEYRE